MRSGKEPREGEGRDPVFFVSFLASIIGAICGIGGGMAGRALNKKLVNAAVDKLFTGLMVLIILISIYNTVRYAGL